MITATTSSLSDLINRLPTVRGQLTADAPLALLTWFRVGGPAEVLFQPADPQDLASFLAGCPSEVPVTILGLGSNLLVRDGGVPGVVIRLGRAFAEIHRHPDDDRVLIAGASASGLALANIARDLGLAGLEFLSGIPGTVGGAVHGNAGAFGREIADVLISVDAVGRHGIHHCLPAEALGLTYRHSSAADLIFTRVRVHGTPGDPAEISRRMAEIRAARNEAQPQHVQTGGSTFANPPGLRAWELIDRAGCRGLVRGDAQVSDKHCNFLINRGQATAAELEGLGEEVRRRVRETTGIDLRWEIRRIGIPGPATPGTPEPSILIQDSQGEGS